MSAPSAPACMYTTTTSALVVARCTMAAAVWRSSRFDRLGYGAKPRKATSTPFRCRTVISPLRPVCAMPCAWRAFVVCVNPIRPKSCEWLFALFMMSNPAWCRYFA